MTTGLRGQPAQLNFNGFTEPIEIVNLTDHEITVRVGASRALGMRRTL
jgi:hypothetical protein